MGISPACFEACPQVCQPMDSLISEYMKDWNTEAIKAKVCLDPEPYTCFFQEGHVDKCLPVLSAGSSFGVEIPKSQAEMDTQCASGSQTSEAPATGVATTQIAATTVAEVGTTTTTPGATEQHHDVPDPKSQEVTSAASGRPAQVFAVSALLAAGMML